MIGAKRQSGSRDPSAPRLFKIGAVMEQTGIGRQTIHNYTVLGLITEATRTPGGHRLYGIETIRTLERIAAWKSRLRLAQIRRKLRRRNGEVS